jgi:hypothetical protein
MTDKSQNIIKKIPIILLLLFWIVLVMVVFLVLYGPPEVQSIVHRMGFDNGFSRLYEWLSAFFVAEYQS